MFRGSATQYKMFSDSLTGSKIALNYMNKQRIESAATLADALSNRGDLDRTSVKTVEASDNRKDSDESGGRKSNRKPWEEEGRRKMAGRVIRQKLPGIETYSAEVVSQVHATPKLILRMERIAGTDRVRINDRRFMNSLSRKIDEEEKRLWKKRVQARQSKETARFRQLIIDGILEPTSDMMDLQNHSIFRVNRIMRRINKLCTTPVQELRLRPMIQAIEPFEEHRRTGTLFGWHANHYLKMSHLPGSHYYVQEDILEAEDEDSEEEHDEAKKADTLTEYLRQESLSQAVKYLNLDPEKLKQFEIKPSPLVQALFEEQNDKPTELLDYSADLVDTLQREQAKTDEFCNKTHRRLFAQ